MSDITARLAEQEERLARDAAELADHADAVAAHIAQWQARRDDRSADPIALPAAALLKNRANAESWGKAISAAGNIAPETLAAFVDAAQAITSALAVRLDYAGAVEATALAAQLRPMVGNAYLPFDVEVLQAVTDAVAAYDVAEAAYKAALTEQANRDNPPSNRRTRGGGGASAAPSWEQQHGWYFHATCDQCGKVVTSRSNTGSLQNDIAKHAGSHVTGPDGKPRDRVYATDVVPEYAAIHKGFTDAMYAVAAGQPEAAGGGWVIRQMRDQAVAA